MFARYTYNPSSTVDNIFNDIAAIITGETNLSNLSANCDQGNSSILSTVGAGWSAHGTAWNISVSNPLTKVSSTRTGTFGSGVITYNDIFYSPTVSKYFDFGAWSTLTPAGLVQLNYSTDGFTSLTPVSYSANSPATSSIVNKLSHMADNGTIIVWLIAGGTTNYAYSSTDGITFASTTAINADWTGLATKGTTFAAVASGVSGSVGGTVASYSTDGITWNSTTIPSGDYKAITSNSSIFVAVGNNVCATSTDGITWTARTIPQNGIYYSIVWNGSVFCAIGFNICATSSDGITWTSRNLNNTSGQRILVDSRTNNFVIFTGLSTLAFSVDGITWNYTTITAFSIVSTTQFKSSVIVNSKIYVANQIVNGGQLQSYDLAATRSKYYKALNQDGSTYKYISLDVDSTNVYLNTYANVVNGVFKDRAYIASSQAIESTYAQRLDLTNGGIIYIMATSYYLILFSYLTNSASWGGSVGATDGPCFGVYEFSRDDVWNTDGNTTYPCWGLMFNNALNMYVPRLKNTSGTDHITTNSFLVEAPDYTISKQILDASNIAYNSAREIRLYNTSGTYLILGGKLLGGIKRTTDSVGTNFDEFTVNSVVHLNLKFSTTRIIVPKQ